MVAAEFERRCQAGEIIIRAERTAGSGVVKETKKPTPQGVGGSDHNLIATISKIGGCGNMKCKRCHRELPQDARYCPACGAKYVVGQNPKRRGNGQGSVYQLANKKWIAVKVIGYKTAPNGKLRKFTRSKSGFRTKKEALDYLTKLGGTPQTKSVTWEQIYETWFPTHRAGKSTMDCYAAAEKYFAPVHRLKLAEISVDDLQACIDDCPKGKRTRQNMKALAGLIYKYALPRNLLPNSLNLGQYLIVGDGDTGSKDASPNSVMKALEANVGKVPGADYVLCQCYLGFRPGELLALDAINYNRKERAFVGGAKTDAGRDRVVTVSPKIQSIVNLLVQDKAAGPVFCAPDGNAMTVKAYRTMFYDVLEKCGIENPVEERDGIKRRKYTPHSCRHTFATLMKRVPGADKDKLELMGHTSTKMLRHYQEVDFADLRRITDAI